MKPLGAALLLALYGVRTDDPVGVTASVETDPVPSGGDAADDPAIWVHPTDPAKSTVIGTDKAGGGLAVYGLDGKEIQYLACGRMNNVDLRYDFPLGDRKVDLVTSGNRKGDTLGIFRIDPATGRLEDAAAREIHLGIRAYGSCMYRSPKTGKYYAIVNSPSGEVEQWELFDDGQGKMEARRVREFKVGSITEGCVADDELGHLYVGEEGVGIWKYDAEATAGASRTQVDRVGSATGLKADVEGLTLYYKSDGGGYLIASGQSAGPDARDVVYAREGTNAWVGTFRVQDADETDGMDVTNFPLGPAFPHGVFVTHDAAPTPSRHRLTPFDRVAAALKLQMDSTWDPRCSPYGTCGNGASPSGKGPAAGDAR